MKVEVLKAVAGNNFLYRSGLYEVPEQMPLEHAKDLIKAGHAVQVESEKRENAAEKTVKEKRNK